MDDFPEPEAATLGRVLGHLAETADKVSDDEVFDTLLDGMRALVARMAPPVKAEGPTLAWRHPGA